MHASNAPIVRPPTEAIDWDGLAWLMGIPKDRREHFIGWLMIELESEWRHVAEPPAKPKRDPASRDADMRKTGRAFIRALRRRDNVIDRRMVEAVNGFLLQNVKEAALGAPRGERPSRFATFLEYVLYVTYALGGRAICNGKTGNGNVVELLNELRPHMPPDFARNWKNAPAIERLCTKARRAEVVEAIADILIGEGWPPNCQRRRPPPEYPTDRTTFPDWSSPPAASKLAPSHPSSGADFPQFM